jgi:hypothetical protein
MIGMTCSAVPIVRRTSSSFEPVVLAVLTLDLAHPNPLMLNLVNTQNDFERDVYRSRCQFE